MNRINKFKNLLWIILGAAAAVAITRFIFGLGATTNLSDNTPWGFWVGFDVMGGVALAAGGFVVAGLGYIFKGKEFKKIARAAVLTAFLGYLAVAIGLLFDLGLPWNIWHMTIYWNPHSPLFEVGWCVMLYLTVLFLEFAPVIFERWPNIKLLRSLYNVLNKIKIPLIILGIMLSTLHQSSLGSLYLAMPYKLHPLWYTPILPIMFFVSAIALGLMMVMVESLSTGWLYGREPEYDVVKRLRTGILVMLPVYLVLRFADILVRGAQDFFFDGSWISMLFWSEMAFSIFIPLGVLLLPKAARSVNLVFFAAMSGVFGMVYNRLNVGGITHLNNFGEIGGFYLPSWTEIIISAGVVAAALLVFFYFIENYKVWEEPPNPNEMPKIRAGVNWINAGATPMRNRFSLGFVFAFAIAFFIMPGDKIETQGVRQDDAVKARGGDTLKIDGNRNGFAVYFKHTMHTGMYSCGTCHHMNKPDDQATGCYECHSKMYAVGDAFNHDWHSSPTGANITCFQCHEQDEPKGKILMNADMTKREMCLECHDNMFAKDAFIDDIAKFETVSYTDAMHGMCISCHDQEMQKGTMISDTTKDLTLCSTCHSETNVTDSTMNMFRQSKVNKWVVVPVKSK